ncbi:DUF6915 family protein [Streptomyces sp. NPDC058440]|uniref:DUF6915 family protein n=1 Tax=Streptomyces sp. NPDC058440 TaxID=3346501 RepID=UPI0036663205
MPRKLNLWFFSGTMELGEENDINSWHHAVSAARKWGGEPELYLPIEEFIDSSKKILGDVRHRSIYHHTEGVWLIQRIFGATLDVPKGNRIVKVPTRLIAERHIIEDLGWLPSPADYIKGMPVERWMSGAQRKEVPLSTLLLNQPGA